ncbi:MAG: family 78 glycoside hydrolase catalytic domain, partial [Phycisphaerae bacterium]
GPWWTNNQAIMPEAEHPAQEALFRAEFAGAGTPRMQIAAHNFYQSWLNGHWLGYGPIRASHGRLTVDEWVLPAAWCQEKNTLAIQVFWEGIFVFDHVRGTPGLWLAVTREQAVLPVELLVTTQTGRKTTHRSSMQRGWVEEIDQRQRARGWPCGPWRAPDWRRPVQRTNDPAVVLEARDIAPYAVHLRRAQSVVFAGACDLRQRQPHRPFYFENNPIYADPPTSPSRQLQEEALLPSQVIDQNLAALTASGQGAAILGVDRAGLDRTVQLDFGQETTGLLELGIEAPAGTVVDIGWSEGVWLDSQMGCWARSPHPDGAVAPREFCDARQSMRYICSGHGPERFNSLFIAAFRHLRLAFRCPRGKNSAIKLQQLQVRTIGYPIERQGTFACADETLNRIYQATLATMENSISDAFLDCPGRERGAYTNDSYWAAMGFQTVSTDTAFERRFLRQFIDSQTAMPYDGFLLGLYPSECARWPGGKLKPWLGHALFWLIQVERYLRLYGDAALRRTWKPAIVKLFDCFGRFRNAEGLLEATPWDTYLDWSRFKTGPIQTGDNLVYAKALLCLGRMFRDQPWTKLGRQTAVAIEQAAWSAGDEYYTDTVVRDKNKKLRPGSGLSALTNSVALWSGLIPQNRVDRVWRQLQNFHPLTHDRPLLVYETEFITLNAVGLLYRLEFEGRRGDIAGLVRDMREAYLPMLERGQNCIGEHLGYQGSLCHGYNGYLAYLLTRYIAGIELPEQPGDVIHIRPRPAQLPWCQARVPWMGGHVQVWWSRTVRGCRIMATLPPGQTGKLMHPTTGKVISFTTSITIEATD